VRWGGGLYGNFNDTELRQRLCASTAGSLLNFALISGAGCVHLSAASSSHAQRHRGRRSAVCGEGQSVAAARAAPYQVEKSALQHRVSAHRRLRRIAFFVMSCSSAKNRPVALITGSSRGIGAGIALELAAAGFNLALHYNSNEAAVHAVTRQLALVEACRFSVHKAQVGSPGECEALVAAVLQAWSRIDVLVNNAGVCITHDLQSSALDFAAFQHAVQETMDVNFLGPANLSFLCSRAFETQPGGGRIINVTSRAAKRGELTAPAYAASKAALNAFGQSMAQHLASKNVLVFTVAPGWVETDMAREVLDGPNSGAILAQHPLGRVAQVQEVSKLVAWLATDAPVAMTASVIDINGASYLH
jgi:3-oxoacyl-[acyl-carrier protein] reductase